MASTRLPGKPLVLIDSTPMLGHVYSASKRCVLLDGLYVATCDQVIADYVTSIGGQAIMTADTHERATDRIAEATLVVERKCGERADIVVMLQGDEPMIRPEMIDEAVQPMLDDPSLDVVNLMAPIRSDDTHDDPNEIKVVVDDNDYALYFSREAIPSRRKGGIGTEWYKQVNVVPFRRSFLFEYTRMTPTPLEIAESIDMLRVLEHGRRVKMVRTAHFTCSVDTEEDRQRVETYIRTVREGR